MKKIQKKINPENHRYLKIFGIIVCSIVVYLLMNNLSKVSSTLSYILGVFTPVTIGLCIAFVLNLPLKFFENFVFGKLTKKNGKIWSKIKRAVCLSLSILLILSLLTLILSFVIPQFISACTEFLPKLPEYVENLNSLIQEYIIKFNLPIDSSFDINIWQTLSSWGLSLFESSDGAFAKGAIEFVVSFFNSVINFLLGFVLAIYILVSKEKLGRLCKSILYATMSRQNARKVISVTTLANKAFTGFVAGQCLEVLTIGVLCFIGMVIFRFPYAIIVSCIIATTAFIPVFGPFIGTAIGAFIILLQSPIKALWFVVFVIILQQLESNIIYPRIMGKQVGLPGVWVLCAVTLGGGFFGMIGIIVSVPLCSVIYTLTNKWVIKRLEEKNVCHRSMSHDSSEPNYIIDENAKTQAEGYEQVLEQVIDDIEHPEINAEKLENETTEKENVTK